VAAHRRENVGEERANPLIVVDQEHPPLAPT
jgi:hypothetical protein